MTSRALFTSYRFPRFFGRGRRYLLDAPVVAKVRAATTTPDGHLRIERLAAIGAAAVALLVLVVWRRRRG